MPSERNVDGTGGQRDLDKKKIEHTNPIYQVYTSFEYQMMFNNQNVDDEIYTKMLLLLPMIPGKKIEHIRLNHLRLVTKEDKGSPKQ